MGTADDPVLRQLIDAHAAGKLVLVVGHGVSEAAGLPSPRRLVELLLERVPSGGPRIEEIKDLASSRKIADAFSALERELGPHELGVVIEHHLQDDGRDLPEIFKAIATLVPGLYAILTTNVDGLIDRATGGVLTPFTSAPTDIAQKRGALLKLHGTLRNRATWTLTRNQHARGPDANRSALATFSRSFTMLFVGYPLADEDFDRLIERIAAPADVQPSRHFALVVNEPGKAYQQGRLEEAGLHVTRYENPDGKHGEAARLLREIGAASERPGSAAVVREIDLRRAWPDAVAFTAPPPLEAHYIRRPDIIERITAAEAGKAIEVVGISGSGKTSLAAEAIEHLRSGDPDSIVFYAAVESEERFRNVLVGFAFELHRFGIKDAFDFATRSDVAEAQVIRDFAHAIGVVDTPLLLLLDLVRGTCSPGFARDLASFVRALASSRIRVAIFGHERALRDVTEHERKEQRIEHLDVRGFNFKEFVDLVGHFHVAADRAALWDVYQRVSAGRSAYLFAALAHSLARSTAITKMAAIAASPPESILSNAEQERFIRVSAAAREAAEKLVCFVLPFRLEEAQAIFEDDNIALAVRELLNLGLLRQHDEERFEMHETVRAGLERLLAVGKRRRAHEVLAGWYGARGLLTAEILHLDKAERHEEARRRAREVFFEGKYWGALAAYVVEHRLISAQEGVCLLTELEPRKDVYVLLSILRNLSDETTADELLRQVREQAERFDKDYSWAWKMVEAILDCDGSKLYDLILFALESDDKLDGDHTRFDWLRSGSRRSEVRIDDRILGVFLQQPAARKLNMLPLLLLDRRRAVMKVAFQFLMSYQEPVNWRHFGEVVTGEIPLRLESSANVIEFLAALPIADPSQMIAARSTLLGPFAELVWSHRRVLQAHCIEILKRGAVDDVILENAIRILVFLAEPALLVLCEPSLGRQDKVGTFAKLVPALLPALADSKIYEERFLDPNLDVSERMGDLVVLSARGVDLGSILAKLNEPDPQRADFLKFMALMQCVMNPFQAAIPLLNEFLAKVTDPPLQIVELMVMRLGSLPTSDATDMLIRALSHAEPGVRRNAAMTLGHRRSRRALPKLLESCATEQTPIAQIMAISAIASGPADSADFDSLWSRLPNGELWRCILAARLRDVSASEYVVAIAIDPTKHWSSRRAAILAAGRLPYEVALEKIAPVVLRERSPFAIDRNNSLLAHFAIVSVALEEAPDMLLSFRAGKAQFVADYGSVFQDWWKDSLSRDDGLPSKDDTAAWLFDRLTHHEWPQNPEAPDLVIWELHIPILHAAVLRALRLCGRPDLIEVQIPQAYHVWFLMRCLKERAAGGDPSPELVSRLRALTATSPWTESPFVANLFKNMRGRKSIESAEAGALPRPIHRSPTGTVTYARYEEIIRALDAADFSLDQKRPLVLQDLTASQCKHLAALLDPGMDYRYVIANSEPAVRFLRGSYAIGAGYVNQVDNRRDLRAAIRPAVASANRFDLAIPWHGELLHDANYAKSFLGCLAALDDPDRWYEELAIHGAVLLPGIGDVALTAPILKYVDSRMIPWLELYSGSGTDTFMEVLCTMARRIEGPQVDRVLRVLFYRWVGRFDHKYLGVQHAENHSLWRAFGRLSGHPRFTLIRDYEVHLSTIRHMLIPWFHEKDIVRVLMRSPRSYTEIESMLFRAADFEHWFEDEVDRLDDAADRLFHQILEED